jgi:hypothetical protein
MIFASLVIFMRNSSAANPDLSKAKPSGGSFELVPIMLGSFYQPDYFFDPQTKSFLVSAMDQETKELLFNRISEDGKKIATIRASKDYRYSFSGRVLFGADGYMDFEKCTKKKCAYASVLNENLKWSEEKWGAQFQALYERASIVDFRLFSIPDKDGIDQRSRGTLFNIKDEWFLLFGNEATYSISYEHLDITPKFLGIGHGFVDLTDSYTGFPRKPAVTLPTLVPQIEDVLKVPKKSEKNGFELKFLAFKKAYSQKAGPAQIPEFLNSETIGNADYSLSKSDTVVRFVVPNTASYLWSRGYNSGLNILHPPNEQAGKSQLAFIEATESFNAGRSGLGVYLFRKK